MALAFLIVVVAALPCAAQVADSQPFSRDQLPAIEHDDGAIRVTLPDGETLEL